MDLTKNIEPAASLKNRSAELIRKVRRTGQPVIITQKGKPAAVLQDIQTYQRERAALYLLKIVAQGDQDYRSGRTVTHAQAKSEFRKKLNRLKRDG